MTPAFATVMSLFLTILMGVFALICWKEGRRYLASLNLAASGVNLFSFIINLIALYS